VILTGGGGTPNSGYLVVTSADVTLVFSNWSTLASNNFDGNGNFSFTNAVDSATPTLLYRIRLP
jgi:hypothetical protein